MSELTGSRIEHEERQRTKRLRERVQRLRDVGWDERADEIEHQSEQGVWRAGTRAPSSGSPISSTKAWTRDRRTAG